MGQDAKILESKKDSELQEDGRQLSDKKIIIRTQQKNDTVVVEITDTGTGIPDDIVNKVFEPFYTTKEVGKGTGLGLSISYGIIKECGGNIAVKSKKSIGTTFSLTFPVRDINE